MRLNTLIEALDCCSSQPTRCGDCPLAGTINCANAIKLEAARALKVSQTRANAYEKIIAMFGPKDTDFLNFKAEEVIEGPSDRALYGFDTNFPLLWLVEDHGFTEEEAHWFISEVHRLHAEKEAK